MSALNWNRPDIISVRENVKGVRKGKNQGSLANVSLGVWVEDGVEMIEPLGLCFRSGWVWFQRQGRNWTLRSILMAL